MKEIVKYTGQLGMVFCAILCSMVFLFIGFSTFPESAIAAGIGGVPPASVPSVEYSGSVSCRKCHEKFYQL